MQTATPWSVIRSNKGFGILLMIASSLVPQLKNTEQARNVQVCRLLFWRNFQVSHHACFWTVGETAVPAGNPGGHTENMQTPLRKDFDQTWI